MYTQILSKNVLVINAEEEKGEEEGRKRKQTKQKTNGHGKHGEKKEKQEVQLLNYQQIPLPCLRNKTKARQKSMKTTETKVKAER